MLKYVMYKTYKWVSYKTYKTSVKCSRTYIVNEKNHNCFLLEGISSLLWEVIINSTTYEEIFEFCRKNDVLDEVDSFINNLKQLNIIYDNDNNDVNSKDQLQQIISNQCIDYEKYEEERINWCIKNGFLCSLLIELTYKCNLKCIHCYNPKNNNVVELKFEEIKPVIDEAIKLGVSKIVLSGGECTLVKDFLKIAKYIRENRISLEIFTNGQTLYDNEKLFNEILNLYPTKVSLSLYSVDETLHEKITNIKGSYKKTVYVLKKLQENNINTEIKSIQLKINADKYMDIVKFGKEINAHVSIDTFLVPRMKGDKEYQNLAISDEQLLKMHLDVDSPLYMKFFNKQNFCKKFYNEHLCKGGFAFVVISPFLKLSPCIELPRFNMDLNKTSLTNIWKNKNNSLAKWQSAIRKDMTECYKHDYCKFCSYCIRRAILMKGYLKAPEILCNEAKIRMKAYKIINTEK